MVLPPKPNFSGTWRWNPRKSVLQIAGPDATLFVIDHRDPFLRLSRTHRVAGKTDSFTIELTTDGAEVVVDREGTRLRARAHWDGDALMFDTVIAGGGEEASNIVRYTLDASGDTIVAEERFRGWAMSYDNRWVLDKEHTPASE